MIMMCKKELKTLKDFKERLFKCDKHKDYCGVIETSDLRQEAIKRVKDCCGECRIDNDTCDACRRDIWFNNLTEEELKDGNER